MIPVSVEMTLYFHLQELHQKLIQIDRLSSRNSMGIRVFNFTSPFNIETSFVQFEPMPMAV